MRKLFSLLCLVAALISSVSAEPCDLNNLLPSACAFDEFNIDPRVVRFGVVDNNPGEVSGTDPANSMRVGSARYIFNAVPIVFDTRLPDCGIGSPGVSLQDTSVIEPDDQVAFISQGIVSDLEPPARSILAVWILDCEIVQDR